MPIVCLTNLSSCYCISLARGGGWQLFWLGHDSAGVVASASLDKPLSLTGLSLLVSANGGKRTICEPTVISVGSSFVLLAGISGDDPPEVVLLLWDIQYSVVLATQKFGVPSTLSYSPKSPLTLELVPTSKSHALLVLSPGIAAPSERMASAVPRRSTVLVVPLGIPRASTIALAMGKARDTQKWLRNTHTTGRGEDTGRRQVVQSVRQALEQSRPQAAETAFFAWVEQETVKLQSSRKMDTPPSDNDAAEKNASGAVSKTRRKKPRTMDKWKVILPCFSEPLAQVASETFKSTFVSSICVQIIKCNSATFQAFGWSLSIEGCAVSYSSAGCKPRDGRRRSASRTSTSRRLGRFPGCSFACHLTSSSVIPGIYHVSF